MKTKRLTTLLCFVFLAVLLTLSAENAFCQVRKQPVPRTSVVAELSLRNLTDGNISYYWLRSDNKEVLYGRLKASQTTKQPTRVGHSWRIRDATGKLLTEIKVDQPSQTAAIRPARAVGGNPPVAPREVGPRVPRRKNPPVAGRDLPTGLTRIQMVNNSTKTVQVIVQLPNGRPVALPPLAPNGKFQSHFPIGTRVTLHDTDTHKVLANKTLRNPLESITLSAPAPNTKVKVPDLYGMTGEEAEAALRQVGLEPSVGSGTTTEPLGELDNRVLQNQFPVAGAEVKIRSRVGFSVIKSTYIPPDTKPMPDLIDLTKEEAEAALKNLGLRPKAYKRGKAFSGRDSVVYQLPAPGTPVPIGERATFYYREGLPDLRGTSHSVIDVPLYDPNDEMKVELNVDGVTQTVRLIRKPYYMSSWYYLPVNPRIAITPEGVPKLNIAHFAYADPMNPKIIQQGTVLQVNFSVDLSSRERNALIDKVAENEGVDRNNVYLTRMPLHDVECVLLGPDNKPLKSKYDEMAFRVEREPLIFSGVISRELGERIATSDESLVTARFSFKYKRLTAKQGLKMKVDFERVQTHFSQSKKTTSASAKYFFLGGIKKRVSKIKVDRSGEIREVIDEMKENQLIQIEWRRRKSEPNEEMLFGAYKLGLEQIRKDLGEVKGFEKIAAVEEVADPDEDPYAHFMEQKANSEMLTGNERKDPVGVVELKVDQFNIATKQVEIKTSINNIIEWTWAKKMELDESLSGGLHFRDKFRDEVVQVLAPKGQKK